MGLTSTTNERITATRSSFSDKAPQAIDEDSTTLGKPAGRDDGWAKRWALWGGKTKGMEWSWASKIHSLSWLYINFWISGSQESSKSMKTQLKHFDELILDGESEIWKI